MLLEPPFAEPQVEVCPRVVGHPTLSGVWRERRQGLSRAVVQFTLELAPFAVAQNEFSRRYVHLED